MYLHAFGNAEDDAVHKRHAATFAPLAFVRVRPFLLMSK